MQSVATSKPNLITGKSILIAVILTFLTVSIPIYYQPVHELKMEKDSGKNGKHSNQKARDKADQDYQKVKKEYEHWDRKNNKTPEEKSHIKKLRRLLDNLKKKKDFSGENHSQKHKGK